MYEILMNIKKNTFIIWFLLCVSIYKQQVKNLMIIFYSYIIQLDFQNIFNDLIWWFNFFMQNYKYDKLLKINNKKKKKCIKIRSAL